MMNSLREAFSFIKNPDHEDLATNYPCLPQTPTQKLLHGND